MTTPPDDLKRRYTTADGQTMTEREVLRICAAAEATADAVQERSPEGRLQSAKQAVNETLHAMRGDGRQRQHALAKKLGLGIFPDDDRASSDRANRRARERRAAAELPEDDYRRRLPPKP